ncbi:MAG: spore germination protein, partial [Anaerotignaceae bacterium]
MENLYNNIDKNIEVIKLAFKGSGDVVFRDFYAGEYRCFLIYIDNIVSGSVVRDDVLETLMLSAQGGSSIKEIQSNAISVGEIGEIKTFTEVFDAVLLGDTVVLGENDNVALQISTKGWPSRG